MKEDYQRSLYEVDLIFSLHPLPFYRQNHEKQKRTGTSYHSLFGLQKMFRKIPLIKISYLDHIDDVTQSVVSELFQKVHLVIYTKQSIIAYDYSSFI